MGKIYNFKHFADDYNITKIRHISENYLLGINWCLVANEPEKNDGEKPLTKYEKEKEEKLYYESKRMREAKMAKEITESGTKRTKEFIGGVIYG
jgi:hypothetical protein